MGKNIISVRDEIIKRNQQLQELINAESAGKNKAMPMAAPALTYSGK